MNQTTPTTLFQETLHTPVATPALRVAHAIAALCRGGGVIVTDDPDRENEGDMIFAAHTLSVPQMAQLIREGSGIVCLVLPESRCRELDLPPMVAENSSAFGTGFTVSIEAKRGVTTGVSAADRVTTIKAAIAPGAKPSDLARPGHVFPLMARPGGLAERTGHTEATLDLMRRAGLPAAGVLAEVTNPDGSMAKGEQLAAFAGKYRMPMVSVADLLAVR
jgi:3,4-dihydroxy 2-butanone 4-phosphate synthase